MVEEALKGTFMADPLDSLTLQWEQQAVIGILEVEKTKTQTLRVSLRIWGQFRKAAAQDDLSKTIDYAQLQNQLSSYIESNPMGLLETLAHSIALQVWENPLAHRVRIKLTKPQALDGALATYKATYKRISKEKPWTVKKSAI